MRHIRITRLSGNTLNRAAIPSVGARASTPELLATGFVEAIGLTTEDEAGLVYHPNQITLRSLRRGDYRTAREIGSGASAYRGGTMGAGLCYRSARIRSAARSPITTHGDDVVSW